MKIDRHRGGPGRASVAASVTVHAVAILVAWWTGVATAEPFEYLVYEIELVSPPPAPTKESEPEAEPAPTQRLVVETPEPTPVAEEIPPPRPAPVERRPEPETRREPPPPPAEAPKPPPAEPRPDARPGGEDINVRMEGLRRDHPVYYENIIRQLRRCFRWRDGGQWTAAVDFVIDGDGIVITSTLRISQQSGNVRFDLTAMEAVECAGNGRFGPLPPEMRIERLPIRFVFSPVGG